MISKIFVIDTNIFLLGVDFNVIQGTFYTTPEILEEIKFSEKTRNILHKVQAGLLSKKLCVKSPSNKFIDEIETQSKITGDYGALSNSDKMLLALALELKNESSQEVVLYTNDYSMENLCTALNVSFSSISKKGIKHQIAWEVYCPYCKESRAVEDLYKLCDRCGTKLKRRPKK